jgi:hypothetical protein
MKQKWHADRVGDSLDVAGFPCGCDSESPAGIHGELHEVRESLWPSVRSVAAICRTDLNGDHGERRSTARATANEWQALDALVTESAHLMLKVRTAITSATTLRPNAAPTVPTVASRNHPQA